LGAVAGLVLVAAGIGLLLSKNWARLTSIGYGVYGVLLAVANAVVMLNAASHQQGMTKIIFLISGLFGAVLGLIYPVLLLIFMTRPKVVAAFQPAQPPP
jgi:hypothetical protein